MSSRSENEILLEKECDRLKAEIDRHVRIYELALKEQAEELARVTAERLRLFDLVRHQRAELHQADLISDTEFASLASEFSATTRFETYDDLRARVAELESQLASEKCTRNTIIASGRAAEQRNAELVAALREALDSPESTISGPLYARMDPILAGAESATPANHPDTERLISAGQAVADKLHGDMGWSLHYTEEHKLLTNLTTAIDAARKQGEVPNG